MESCVCDRARRCPGAWSCHGSGAGILLHVFACTDGLLSILCSFLLGCATAVAQVNFCVCLRARMGCLVFCVCSCLLGLACYLERMLQIFGGIAGRIILFPFRQRHAVPVSSAPVLPPIYLALAFATLFPLLFLSCTCDTRNNTYFLQKLKASFDECAIPICPSEFSSPLLHNVMSDQR